MHFFLSNIHYLGQASVQEHSENEPGKHFDVDPHHPQKSDAEQSLQSVKD